MRGRTGRDRRELLDCMEDVAWFQSSLDLDGEDCGLTRGRRESPPAGQRGSDRPALQPSGLGVTSRTECVQPGIARLGAQPAFRSAVVCRLQAWVFRHQRRSFQISYCFGLRETRSSLQRASSRGSQTPRRAERTSSRGPPKNTLDTETSCRRRLSRRARGLDCRNDVRRTHSGAACGLTCARDDLVEILHGRPLLEPGA